MPSRRYQKTGRTRLSGSLDAGINGFDVLARLRKSADFAKTAIIIPLGEVVQVRYRQSVQMEPMHM